jgi:hypothetical protein
MGQRQSAEQLVLPGRVPTIHLEPAFHYACSLDSLQLLIANLNMFILFRFVRDEPGLTRGSSVAGATVDVPGMLALLDCCFGIVASASL